MKKYSVYSLLALGVVALSGCQDEEIVKPVNPAVTGEEITFGSSLYGAETRTIYGDEPVEGAYPVTWEQDDQISIYCPEAARGKIVKYKVTPDAVDASKSSAVTKVNENELGLQWGAAETHHFSAFYPGDKIQSSIEGKLMSSIPANQDPVEWKKEQNAAGGTTYTGIANTGYAFMWAYASHDKSDGSDVALNFKPWVTILDVEINGPANANEAVKMSSVQLRSLSGETLNGEFLIDFNPVEDNESNYPTYEEAGNPHAIRSQISIQLYDDELVNSNGTKGDFITLKQGDKIVVRFYLLPKDVNYDTNEGRNDLQIRVAPFNSAVLTRTLNAQEGSKDGGILAHKVNKVILPPVTNSGLNYWMSSLDPNIYVTELSLPGSKMSYQTSANGAAIAYQNLSIADQFNNGIRAFQIQTIGRNTSQTSGQHGITYGGAENMTLRMSVGGSPTDIPFKDIVKTIADGLATAEKENKTGEYAFLLLTYSGSGDVYGGYWENDGWIIPDWNYKDATPVNRAWMEAVKNDLAEMANDPQYRLYTEEITPSTTLSQVAGKIIIKVNYNDNEMANQLAADSKLPAMFAIWGVGDQTDSNAGFTPTSAYAINNLRWGTSNHSVSSNMKWFYHEATSVGFEDDGGEETESVKLNNVEDMWNKSIEYYKNNEDNSMWFLNDLGGSYCNGSGSRYAEDAESQNGVDDWTEKIGPYATNLLQNRTEDATLGIVLMNYADPSNEYSGNLIQTIINNNFNFQLRTKGDASSQQFNATYTNGGKAIGWD